MRKTVLIVDDNVFIRTALCQFFEREPDFHVCAVAENGREAIEEAARLHPDLIILDVAMPVMNGLEAARILKQMSPEVPLILYSAMREQISEALARSIGISALISKTDRVTVLIEKARGLVGRRAA